MHSQKFKDGEVAAKPGEHYIAVEPAGDDGYFMFPAETGDFCHAWVMFRGKRPQVIVIEGSVLPNVKKTGIHNAQ